eukprot:g931.t1
MLKYCENDVDCRRQLLLKHFEERFDKKCCEKTCDNCINEGRVLVTNVNREAQAIVRIARDVTKPCTIGQLVQIFRGQNNKFTRTGSLDSMTDFGVGKRFKSHEANYILHQMIMDGYLEEREEKNAMGFSNMRVYPGDRRKVAALERGSNQPVTVSIRQEKKIATASMKPRKPKSRIRAGATVASASKSMNGRRLRGETPVSKSTVDRQRLPDSILAKLFFSLKKLTRKVATEHNVRMSRIFLEATLDQLADRVPVTIEQFSKVAGVTEAKVKKYGKLYVDHIVNWLKEAGVKPKGKFDDFTPLKETATESHFFNSAGSSGGKDIRKRKGKKKAKKPFEVVTIDESDDDKDAFTFDNDVESEKKKVKRTLMNKNYY